MNCNCIEEIEQQTEKTQWHRRNVVSAQLESLFQWKPVFNRITCSVITLHLEGQTEPVDVNMKHNFCPFCGKAITEAAEPLQNANGEV
jgi:hypothetical protein